MKNKEWVATVPGKEAAEAYCLDKIMRLADWLEAERKTTGHEDLVNAGWEFVKNPGDVVYRSTSRGQKVIIGETNIWYDTHLLFFTDTEIDFLRKCAEKIRKENGWA